MTLNGVVALILRFSLKLIASLSKYVTVVEYRPIMSINVVPLFQYSTFCHNSPTLQRGLSAIAELLVTFLTFLNVFYICVFSRLNSGSQDGDVWGEVSGGK